VSPPGHRARLLASRGSTPGLQRLTGAVLLVSAAAWLVRAVLIATGPAQSSLFISGPGSDIAFLDALLLPIVSAVGFLSMIARRMQEERDQATRELEAAPARCRP
jgi:hypothetical protein